MTRPAIPPAALERFRLAAANIALHGAARAASNAAPSASPLLPIKDDIAALRKRGVSYRAISELLAQSGIPASDTSVMRFCNRVLKTARQRAASRTTAPAANPHAALPAALPAALSVATPAAPVASNSVSPTPTAPTEVNPYRSRGPHIAKVELLKPDPKI